MRLKQIIWLTKGKIIGLHHKVKYCISSLNWGTVDDWKCLKLLYRQHRATESLRQRWAVVSPLITARSYLSWVVIHKSSAQSYKSTTVLINLQLNYSTGAQRILKELKLVHQTRRIPRVPGLALSPLHLWTSSLVCHAAGCSSVRGKTGERE